jgi:hypothetical protein
MRFLKELHGKRVSEVFFVFGDIGVTKRWNFVFKNRGIWSRNIDDETWALDVPEAVAKKTGVLGGDKEMSWEIAARVTRRVFEQALMWFLL